MIIFKIIIILFLTYLFLLIILGLWVKKEEWHELTKEIVND